MQLKSLPDGSLVISNDDITFKLIFRQKFVLLIILSARSYQSSSVRPKEQFFQIYIQNIFYEKMIKI